VSLSYLSVMGWTIEHSKPGFKNGEDGIQLRLRRMWEALDTYGNFLMKYYWQDCDSHSCEVFTSTILRLWKERPAKHVLAGKMMSVHCTVCISLQTNILTCWIILLALQACAEMSDSHHMVMHPTTHLPDMSWALFYENLLSLRTGTWTVQVCVDSGCCLASGCP